MVIRDWQHPARGTVSAFPALLAPHLEGVRQVPSQDRLVLCGELPADLGHRGRLHTDPLDRDLEDGLSAPKLDNVGGQHAVTDVHGGCPTSD